MNGDETMFYLLENAGASCRNVVTTGGNTLLHWFCYTKANDEHTSLLTKLIDIGCNIDAENYRQHTPLMLAAKFNMLNTCKILIDANADIDKVDYKGFRAIDLAKIGSECFKLLQRITRIQQKKSQSHQHINRITEKKQATPQRPLSMHISESIDLLKTYKPSNIVSQEKKLETATNLLYNKFNPEQKNDTKYKHMWEKYLNKKPKIRGTKHLSLQKINDLF